MPGCSTREPQRWHSTAFRFRPSADTRSLGGAAGSMASTRALGGDAHARSQGDFFVPRRRGRGDAASAQAPLPGPGRQCAGAAVRCRPGGRRGFVTDVSWDVTELLPRLTWALGFPYTE